MANSSDELFTQKIEKLQDDYGALKINSKEFTITKSSAFFAVIVPFGISLSCAVLSFSLSISLSIYLLKAIAADRAKIIQSITYIKVSHLKLDWWLAKKKPIKANGIAKMVWLNFIKER